ncbi:PQQ-binding-like beta-propeller repeat protein [Streptomyces sp. TP-A0356]|uniref:outer membrane protein assembly factor BamB family protein n=1 Tax=Streptomyces sp. TP-A0356 TaxID=1359208 RepID=UPI001F202BDD|nr:PQQ-binding-like beta-propeller repeat protein [Streptomyces sp. TP-A0356]
MHDVSFGPPPSMYTESALAADGARTRRRRRVLAVAVCALVAVLGVGGWLMWYQSGRKSADTGVTAVRQAPDEIRETVEKAPRTPEGAVVIEHDEEHLEKHDTDPRYAPGTWATHKIFAKGVADTITGLRIGVGSMDERAWTLKLDGHLCATTSHVTVDGRTAVVVQPAQPKGAKNPGVCDEVLFFDIDTGRKLWRAKIPDAAAAFVTDTNLTMTRSTVAVAWGRGSVAFDMEDGRQLWKSTSVSACEDKGFAGGRALLAVLRCGQEGDPTYEVQKVDPRTGRTVWTYKIAKGVQAVYLPSSDPPVLAVGAGDITVTDLITLDGKGRRLASISMHGDRYDPLCGKRYGASSYFGDVEYCDGMVVGPTEVFVASKDETEVDQASNWIMAFDIRTGKTVRKFEGRALQPVHPLRMSGDQLLVYRGTRDSIGPAAVVLWNPSTGKETPFLFFTLPSDDDYTLSSPENSDIVVEQGRVFFAKRELTADLKRPKAPVLGAIGIGSAE